MRAPSLPHNLPHNLPGYSASGPPGGSDRELVCMYAPRRRAMRSTTRSTGDRARSRSCIAWYARSGGAATSTWSSSTSWGPGMKSSSKSQPPHHDAVFAPGQHPPAQLLRCQPPALALSAAARMAARACWQQCAIDLGAFLERRRVPGRLLVGTHGLACATNRLAVLLTGEVVRAGRQLDECVDARLP